MIPLFNMIFDFSTTSLSSTVVLKPLRRAIPYENLATKCRKDGAPVNIIEQLRQHLNIFDRTIPVMKEASLNTKLRDKFRSFKSDTNEALALL